MLKDKLANFFKEKESDPFNINIMDGFVNIKGYKVQKDGTKKLVYHDCGDNVVTDWMRHVIMLLLTGTAFTSKGISKNLSDAAKSKEESEQISAPSVNNHPSKELNLDAYLLNKEQYCWNYDEHKEKLYKYSQPNDALQNNIYSLFPTKVLFGTGLEYANWEELKLANEKNNKTWYDNMLKAYGGQGGDQETAANNFDSNINKACNAISGEGTGTKKRTVNPPDTRSDQESYNMNKKYSVDGPVKTLKFESPDSPEGPYENGVGRPCFLYFSNQVKKSESETTTLKEAWDDPASEISLSKDASSKYLNKITFRIVMPAQTNENTGLYYPYNGYSLKQIGLYNDSKISNNVDPSAGVGPSDNVEAFNNMPCGTLLAIKNISKIEKTPDLEIVMTWTLTI